MNIGQFLEEEGASAHTTYEGNLVDSAVAAYEAANDVEQVFAIESQLSNAYDTLAAAAQDKVAAITAGNESADDGSLDARMEATVMAVAGTLGLGDQIVAGNESADEKGNGLMKKIWTGIVNAGKKIWEAIINFGKKIADFVSGIFSKGEDSAEKLDKASEEVPTDVKTGDKVEEDKQETVAEALQVLALSTKPEISKDNIIKLVELQKFLLETFNKGDLEKVMLSELDAIEKVIVDSAKTDDIEKITKTVDSILSKVIGSVKASASVKNIFDGKRVVKAKEALAKKAGVDVKDVEETITSVTTKHVKVGLSAVRSGDKAKLFFTNITVTPDKKGIKALSKTATKMSKDDLQDLVKTLKDTRKTVKETIADITKRSENASKAVDKVMNAISKNIDSDVTMGAGSKELAKNMTDTAATIMKDILPKMYAGAIETANDLANSKAIAIAKASLPEKETKDKSKL